jgi:membrane-bound ClpP family serine protease
MVIAGIALFTFCFFELAAPVLVVGYILLQWILGFPDKELWIPSNRPYNPKSDISDTLISKIATTQTPLRPTGYILIKNKEYLAKSEINFIDKNTPVEITAISNGTIIVDLSKKMES